MMRTKLASALFVLLLTACLPPPIPEDSGVYGQVTIGPTCPVMQAENPCPDKPFQATLTVLSQADHQRVVQFQTDPGGLFREALAPGDYILQPESPSVMPHAPDQNFTVPPHGFVQLNISYDSGIR